MSFLTANESQRKRGNHHTSFQINFRVSSTNFRHRCPSGFGPPGPNPLADTDPPGPNPLADMDPPGPNTLADLDPLRGFGPPTKLSENIVFNVLVKMDDTLRSSAY